MRFSKAIDVPKCIAIVALTIVGLPYVVSMYLLPVHSCGVDFECVQAIWSRWQSLNVGMLAFTSSIVAFIAVRTREQNRLEGQLQVAAAFLPSALSELIGYFEKSAAFLKLELAEDKSLIGKNPPRLPTSYRDTFSKCIQLAAPSIAVRCADILSGLQVHESRMRGAAKDYSARTTIRTDRDYVLSRMYSLGMLQAQVASLFAYGRGESSGCAILTVKELANAYSNLEIDASEEFRASTGGSLIEFTERAIKRERQN